MARKAKSGISEKGLSKGQLRKLNALRKSVGDDIGEKAFLDWIKKQSKEPAPKVDKNAEVVVSTLNQLVNSGKLRIPRGGRDVRCGRSHLSGDRRCG